MEGQLSPQQVVVLHVRCPLLGGHPTRTHLLPVPWEANAMGLRRTLGALRGVGHYCVIMVGQVKQYGELLAIDSART